MKQHVIKFRAQDKVNFNTIVDGRKTIETRAATPRYRNYNVGDELVIRCGDEEVIKRIQKIEFFRTIDLLITAVGLSNVMPLVRSTEEAKKVWYSFPGYKEKIEKLGLVAFYL